ncbi:MAG: glucose-1-phosphate thymidylyltransferase [Anaerolineae bacterium]|nr:glucose-1-phosphate thymidylyltransferase [Anaerolineae bacterium]
MKGLILSGGKGTRLRPLTYTRAKQLTPIANKPVLFRVIEALCDAGITEIGIIIAADTGAEIQETVGNGSRWGVNITFIPQSAPLGLAHAVKTAQPFIGDDRFVMYLGDNVIQGGISSLIADFVNHPEWNSQIVLKHVEQPEQFGVAILSEDGRIKSLVEKPKSFISDLALIGVYMFDSHIFEAADAIKPSWRNELEITDAIQWLVQNGYNVYPHIHEGWWIDTGKQDDMLRANSYVLEELTPAINGTVDLQSSVDARVTIEAGAEVINSVIRGPAIIGEGTRIVNSYIGPFTSIYHHCTIEHCEIEYSIVLENSSIQDVDTRIQDSLIGRNVEIARGTQRPKALKLTLADYSKLGIQ